MPNTTPDIITARTSLGNPSSGLSFLAGAGARHAHFPNMEESRKSKMAKQWGRKALNDYADRMNMAVAETPPSGSFRKLATYDAMMIDFKPYGFECSAIIEVKARWFTEETLEHWNNEWMMSKSKMDRCKEVAIHSRVPFYGVCVSIPLKAYWVVMIAGIDGEDALPIRYEEIETQKSTEGGSKTDTLGYINLNYATKHNIQTKHL